MKKVRQSTVEPVFGTLINFMGMSKISTRGIEQANKVMLMAGTAYNLQKLMRYIQKTRKTAAISLRESVQQIFLNINNAFYQYFELFTNIYIKRFGYKYNIVYSN